MKFISNVICIILTAFFLICAIMSPGLSSVFMLIAAMMCLPIKQLDDARKKLITNKAVRIIIVVALFIVGIAFMPDPSSKNNGTDVNTQQTNQNESIKYITATETTKETEAETEAPAVTNTESREDYIAKCETVVYSDVERNPKNFEGKNIMINGTVIQVSEGWFNSVTLRIESNEGIWYATYKRDDDESRILENDFITAYGKCTGVETYKTLLGANMTIPGMEIKYYETTEKYPISDDTAKYTEGQHKVGTDIPAGQYMLIQTGSSSAYYSITSDANGNDIINNDNFKNHSIVEVMDGEYISLSRCYAVPLADAPVVSSSDGYLGDGCYIVGRDIAAGEYKIESTEEVSAYVCIYPDVRRTKIISNDNFSGSRYISVENGQMIEINRGRISVGEQ